jgi:hypothetical protein
MEVKVENKRLSFLLQLFASKLLEKYKFVKEKVMKSLLNKANDLPTVDMDSKWLRSVLSLLQYLENSARPYLAYIVNYSSRFQGKIDRRDIWNGNVPPALCKQYAEL